ncbi:uncharacterized protein LOC129220203 [Uloborus diversus]|uniref:uncharacterized protein LOC129220203 n=1 Tax=Uloborus diversus TaxID=327109 RepID=UPI00240940BC|nr:uncharacterized protein LOC129220203 [Uloborus diversus]
MAALKQVTVTIWMLLLLAANVKTETLDNSVEEGDDEFSPTIFDPAHPYESANSTSNDPSSDKRERVIIPDWAVFLPHERYCQYFYVFDGSQSSIFRCVNGYRFDAEKLQCMKSSSVDCGRRQKNVDSSEENKVGINFRCPRWTGLYPHQHYCHLLYDCQNKKPQLLMCPPGMLYDSYNEGCTQDRDSVDCGKRENIYKDEDPDNDIVIDDNSERYHCPAKSGVHPHPKYCNKFIRCWFGIGSVYVCPKGAFYDVDLEKCRSKKSVYCDGRIDPDDTDYELIFLEEDRGYNCPALNGRFRHEDCRKFYRCVDGHPYLYLCPYEQRFDPQQLRCRFQESGEDICSKETIEEEEEFVCPAREGTFIDEHNCGSYYKCSKGKARHINCTETELYDPDWRSCADEKEVTCGDRTLPGDDPNDDGSNIVDENPKQKCKKRHGRFTHEQICNWYYHCKDGKATVRACPKGKFFDAKKNTCEDNVDCGRRKPNDDDDVTTTVKPPEFVCPQKSGKFPHPKNCAAYYVCERSKFKMFTCAKGKLYNEKSRNCEKEDKVTCSNRDLPDQDPDSRILDPNPDFQCPSFHGFFDHLIFCDWFYYCRDSEASLWECGKGKYFDRNSRMCLPSAEVNCEGRQRPEDRITTTTTTEGPIITEWPTFKCPKADGEFAHEHCGKFYHCTKWNFHVHDCPKDKFFDENKNKCEPKSRVSCGNRINPDEPTYTEHPRFECPKADGEFAHEHCEKYYHCTKWDFHEHDCPKDKLFDATKNKCEPKERVSCGGRIHPDGITESPQEETTVPDRETTVTVQETTVTEKLTTPTEATTVTEKQTSPTEPTTVTEKQTSPTEATTVTEKQTSPTEATTVTEKQTSPTEATTQPDETTQTTEQTTLETQTTPEPAVDTTTNKVVTPEPTTASPPTETTKDGNTDKIIDPNPNHECKKPNGKFAHDQYCHYYYECKGNKAQLRQCPKSKYFHLERGTCENWYEVSCGNRLKPEGE